MNLESLYREEWRRVLATTVRLTGDFDLSEEAVQDAFVAALEQWPRDGAPANPYAWLVSAARNRVVDHLRRRARFRDKQTEIAQLTALEESPIDLSEAAMVDDQLRLIFTCCHPAIALDAQVALTLRTVCGLTTEEIARGFLVPVPAMAQRLVRVKRKIRDAGLPFAVPPRDRLPERLDAVMLVVYLVFTEGYAATSGKVWIRRQFCEEAIRLGRLLCELIPRNAELRALLALMLLHDSRRVARAGPDEEIVTLEEQNRELWDQRQIAEGLPLLESALRDGAAGVYALQAAIAALHARAARVEDTDWGQIARLYDVLLQKQPSPVVELNRAAAVAMADGPSRGLELIAAIEVKGTLAGYHLLPAARADLLRRDGRWREAAEAYRQALCLVANDPERRYLNRRLAEVEGLT
ncbi:MAG TPA: RNA polymerase sigma factor [Bryobacteraceae bacterium]|jgi:RNA polymerase sigma-70 factor (ECF subfamily)|nr:RNA polymerase sigma factor [Bryobacteraceae bacterium]